MYTKWAQIAIFRRSVKSFGLNIWTLSSADLGHCLDGRKPERSRVGAQSQTEVTIVRGSVSRWQEARVQEEPLRHLILSKTTLRNVHSESQSSMCQPRPTAEPGTKERKDKPAWLRAEQELCSVCRRARR